MPGYRSKFLSEYRCIAETIPMKHLHCAKPIAPVDLELPRKQDEREEFHA